MTDKSRARENAKRFGRLSEIIFSSAELIPVALWLLSTLRESKFLSASSSRIRDHLQDQFDLIAEDLVGRIDLTGYDKWQEDFKKLVASHLFLQYVAAKERSLLLSEITQIVAPIVVTQLNFVEKFAADVLRLSRTENPYSAAQIISRSRLYSGAGRGLWFRASEEDLEAEWVIDYIATDDAGTCLPCFVAQVEGPYLAQSGPMPGEVCLGRGRCRCTREPRLDEVEYRNLLDESGTIDANP